MTDDDGERSVSAVIELGPSRREAEEESQPTHPTDHGQYVLMILITAAFYLAVGIIIGWWFL